MTFRARPLQARVMPLCRGRPCRVWFAERPYAAPNGYRCGRVMKPGTQLERKPAPVATRADAATTGDERWERAGAYRLEFRPALWLLIAAEVVSRWLGRPSLGTGALLGLAWRSLPRKLKLAAGGAAAVALLLIAGSVAALVLALSRLA